ncbi:coiled-coil domain-containing protein 37 [Austrofundulus limnaeus]|uniref:Coiled-coil domain-containing protein 37 n=1 Tax=Austrofundulus limnaeus TaxID=52670 RepID=A0A2I4D2S7_AUSLI|nr:PREDICTED: coiled-coil domain-containing protein 37-like [Austrofundulus limnaeus]
MTKKSEMMKMDEIIAKEERKLEQLANAIERDNQKFEEFLKDHEKKAVESRTLFEREDKSKQEKNIEIEKLVAETRAVKSEISKFEELLTDYKIYKEFLFKISPSVWQHKQVNKTLKAEVVSEEDGQDDHNKKPQEMATGNCLESKLSNSEKELSSIKDIRASAQSDTLVKNCEVDFDSSEDEAELYFTEPQQLLNLMTELTDQNLSLILNSARVKEELRKLRQSITTTKREIEEEEEEDQIFPMINEMKQNIVRGKERGLELQQMVQLHETLSTNSQNAMLEALNEKVGEVHCSCVDDRKTNFNTLEKVANIKNLLISLLESLVSIPEEKLQKIKKIKDSEKRSRQREEKQRDQEEKQKERMRRYQERTLAVSKKVNGRKLMPRCLPVSQS